MLSWCVWSRQSRGSHKQSVWRQGISITKARIWAPSWFPVAAPRGWSNLKPSLTQEGKHQEKPLSSDWGSVGLLTILVGVVRNKHWRGLVSTPSTWQQGKLEKGPEGTRSWDAPSPLLRCSLLDTSTWSLTVLFGTSSKIYFPSIVPLRGASRSCCLAVALLWPVPAVGAWAAC